MDEYDGIYDDDVENPSDLLDVIEKKNKEIERLEGAVKKYGRHSSICSWTYKYGAVCNCGFKQALKGVK